jgi:hypothetical protein
MGSNLALGVEAGIMELCDALHQNARTKIFSRYSNSGDSQKLIRLAPSNRVQIGAMLEAKHRRTGMEPIDLLADTRRYLDAAIRQLAAIEAGAPIAKPVTTEQAINIVTEQIGLFESVLRRYGGRENGDRR